MSKNRKHEPEFRLQIVSDHHSGQSVTFLSRKWNISKTQIRKWIDHHHSGGAKELLPKRYCYYTKEFKLEVVKAYRDKGLSLRTCCLEFNIPTQSTLVSWARKYEQLGVDGLNGHKGRPAMMKKDKPETKKAKPLTRVEELEQENLYLKAENDFLKKLDALTREKQTQQRKKH